MQDILGELLFYGIGSSILMLWWRWRIDAAADRADEQRGCLACDSPRLRREDEQLHCLDCGYIGRADRGGYLDDDDLASLQMGDDEMSEVPRSVSVWRD